MDTRGSSARGTGSQGHHARRELHVAAQQSRRQVAVELHAVLDDRDLVIISARVGCLVGNGDRYVLTEIVRASRA